MRSGYPVGPSLCVLCWPHWWHRLCPCWLSEAWFGLSLCGPLPEHSLCLTATLWLFTAAPQGSPLLLPRSFIRFLFLTKAVHSARLKVNGLISSSVCFNLLREESRVLLQPRQPVVLFLNSGLPPLPQAYGPPLHPPVSMWAWTSLLSTGYHGPRESHLEQTRGLCWLSTSVEEKLPGLWGSCLFCGRMCGFPGACPWVSWVLLPIRRPRFSDHGGSFLSPAARPGVPEGCLQTLGQIKWLPGLDDSGPGLLPCFCSGL